MKFSFFRFWQRHEPAPVNFSFYASYIQTIYTNHVKGQFASFILMTNMESSQSNYLSAILMWSFRCSCSRFLLNSLLFSRNVPSVVRIGGHTSIIPFNNTETEVQRRQWRLLVPVHFDDICHSFTKIGGYHCEDCQKTGARTKKLCIKIRSGTGLIWTHVWHVNTRVIMSIERRIAEFARKPELT